MSAKQAMRVIVLACSKGGTGKSTLSTSLAVLAAADTKQPVAVIDLDPQESASSWFDRRKHHLPKQQSPMLVKLADGLADALEELAEDRVRWVFIDTPPSKLELIEPGIAVADLVLVPCRPSALDIEQTDIAVELAESHHVPFAFVLNHAPGNWMLTRTSAALLRKGGRIVLDPPITFRQCYMAAMTVGKSAPEVERDGKAQAELAELWDGIQAVLAKSSKVVRHDAGH